MEKKNNLATLNEALFKQLEILSEINVKSEEFENEKQRANSVCEIADRIIKNGELELRNQVWQATRRYKLSTRPTHLGIGIKEDYADEDL